MLQTVLELVEKTGHLLSVEQAAALLENEENGVASLSQEFLPSLFSLKCVALQVSMPKCFERNGRKGRVCNALFQDLASSKEFPLTFWNEQVYFAERIEGKAQVLLQNLCKKGEGIVPSRYFSFQILQPAPSTELSKVFQHDVQNFSCDCKVLEEGKLRLFENKFGKGCVYNAVLGSEKCAVKAVLWNEQAVYASSFFAKGLALRIENAFSKNGEVHLNGRSRIVLKQ